MSQHDQSNVKPPVESKTCDDQPPHNDGETLIYIDPEKEKGVLRKFDLLALPQFILLVILSYLDRTNIG